jgi:hypothetical protein
VTLEAVEKLVKNRYKPVSEAKCQNLFFNTLMLVAKTDVRTLDETIFVRELFQTVRCDSFHDLKHVRENYADHIGLDELRRIVTKKQTESDREATADAFAHYGEWTRHEMVKALSLTNKTKYYLFHRPLELFATMLTVSGWTAYRIAKIKRRRS